MADNSLVQFNDLQNNQQNNIGTLVNTSILILRIKVFFYILTSILTIFVIYKVLYQVRADINATIEKEYNVHKTKIKKCEEEYQKNKCFSSDLPQLLKDDCEDLYNCMNSHPSIPTTAEVAAEYTAYLINNFVNNLSAKSMIFIFSTTVLVVVFSFKFGI